MKADRTNKRDEHKTSLERYLLMNDKEKDAEIEKAVTRLQKRIQEILYLLGTEKSGELSEPRNEKKSV